MPRLACLAIAMLVDVSAVVVAHGQEAAKTYKWVIVGGSGHADQAMAAQVREAVDQNRKPDKRQKDIEKAVAKLLKKYPAAAK